MLGFRPSPDGSWIRYVRKADTGGFPMNGCYSRAPLEAKPSIGGREHSMRLPRGSGRLGAMGLHEADFSASVLGENLNQRA